MLGRPTGFPHGTTRVSVALRMQRGARAAVPLRALIPAALLALLTGAALSFTLPGPHSGAGALAGHGVGLKKGLASLPLTLRGPVSATLGAEDPAYRLSVTRGSFRAANPAQRLRTSFDSSGVLISSGAVHVGLRLRAAGYGAALRALPRVSPSAKGNHISYRYGPLSEWYVNGPLGVEQGFTIPRALDRHGAGPLRLSLGIVGSARVALVAGGRGVSFTAKGSSLRYMGLSATDARGRVLASRLRLKDGQLLLSVDAAGAGYPLRVDPLVQQGRKITGSGEIGQGEYGYGVALSTDGNTALIGGLQDNKLVGAAWVFTRSGSTWTQQGKKLTGGGEIGGGFFGNSVALSGDGNTALIGGLQDNGAVGAAWVFTRSGSTWTQQGAKLTGNGEIGKGFFGRSVALSGDGSTALIGGADDNNLVGAAWVFTRSGSTWTQQGEKLTGGGETGNASFGYSVALSDDGSTAVIGGYHDNVNVGAAWAFTRSGSIWTQQGEKLTASGESGQGDFAYSVALSQDGNTALFGGWTDNGFVGAAWVFTRSGSTWTQQGKKLTASDELGEGEFAHSVALSDDGSTAVIGGSDNLALGAVWVFTRSGSAWSQQGKKLTASGESGAANAGFSVAISGDANTALAGGPFDHNKVGASWVFVNPGSSAYVTGVGPNDGPAAGGTSVSVTGINFTGASAVKFGSINATSFTVNSDTSITAVSPAQVAGTVDVTVTTSTGTSATNSADQFVYLGAPEYGTCIRVAAGAGRYENSGCTKEGAEKKYEWYPAFGGPRPLDKTQFTTNIKSTTTTLATVGGKKISCKGQTGTGEYTGNKTVGNVLIRFAGCEGPGGKCSSAGSAEGEIATNALTGELGVVLTSTEGSIKNKIGSDLKASGGGSIAEFLCGASADVLRGSVIVEVKTNSKLSGTTLKYDSSKGVQKPTHFEGKPSEILETSFGGGPFEQSGLTLTTLQSNEEKVEVNSVI